MFKMLVYAGRGELLAAEASGKGCLKGIPNLPEIPEKFPNCKVDALKMKIFKQKEKIEKAAKESGTGCMSIVGIAPGGLANYIHKYELPGQEWDFDAPDLPIIPKLFKGCNTGLLVNFMKMLTHE